MKLDVCKNTYHGRSSTDELELEAACKLYEKIVYFAMAIYQETITLSPKSKGFHLITQEIEKTLLSMPSIETGLLHLFIKHTSASLSINENADPSVREDMENFFTDIADNKPYYIHTYEGSDDMPAHIKSSMLGSSLSIPITNGRMNLGTWQGIYLGEHREYGGNRRIVVTLYG